MGDLSLADIKSVVGDDSLGGSSWIIILILFLLMFKNNGFNGDGFNQYATAASQNEILMGQQFDRLSQMMTSIGNGISDATFSLNNTISGEGRNLSSQMCNGFNSLATAIHTEGEATRGMLQQQTIATLQDQLAQARCENSNYAQSRYILGELGRYYTNPPCYNSLTYNSGCGCA